LYIETVAGSCRKRRGALRLSVTIGIVSLLLTACHHVEPEPERRSSQAEIRQHISGTWTLDERSDDILFPQIIISPDGRFTGVLSDGTRELVGTWKLEHRILVVETVKANDTAVETVAYYPVVFASERELVCTPGISVAGRLRFTR
jgi:hypothetical protein